MHFLKHSAPWNERLRVFSVVLSAVVRISQLSANECMAQIHFYLAGWLVFCKYYEIGLNKIYFSFEIFLISLRIALYCATATLSRIWPKIVA
jgi:hypothetical protein